MKRARRDEPNVWPSKKAVTSFSNANAQWPALTTQPSSRRGAGNSLLLGNAAATISAEAALSGVAAAPNKANNKKVGFDDKVNGEASPKQMVAKHHVMEDKKVAHIPKDADAEENQPPHVPKTNKDAQVDRQAPKSPPRTKLDEAFDEAQHIIPGALAFMVDQEAELYCLHFVSKAFHLVSAAIIMVWISLMVLAFKLAAEEDVRRLDTAEHNVALVAAALILLAMSTKIVPIIIARGRKAFRGILIGSIAVQTIALSTNLLMAFRAFPIITDPVTGARVYTLRWCEWSPLAFAMTFFTEGVNVAGGKQVPMMELSGDKKLQIMLYWRVLKVPVLLSSAMGLSTFMGFLFPFLPGVVSWSVAMFVSCILFLVLFPRLYMKRAILRAGRSGKSTEEKERYERIELSYRLLFTCAVCWSFLVLFYTVGALAHRIAPEGSFWASPSLPFFCETTMDVIAKAFYMDVIVDVHKFMFDETSRATRRLEELRRMMAVVWDCSSDVIALSVRGVSGTVITMISPTFHKIERIVNHYDQTAPIVFEMEESDISVDTTNENLEPTGIYFLDILPGDHVSARRESVDPIKHPGFLSMRNLIRRGWAISSEEQTIHHSLLLENKGSIKCETKATRLGPHALVLVMRDISERHKRFEAEKIAISECTARKKDEEANRFTRHEVKNGLLASIGLCDSLREAISEETGRPIDRTTSGNLSSLRLMSMLESNKKEKWKDPLTLHRNIPGQDGVQILVKELDLTLRDILDTVLSEAMARDVIHEVYQPKLERVDIHSVLGGGSEDSVTNRFPFVTDPSPLPLFLFDLQLLKFIHRNAVSNACKYGKKGGVVLTEVRHLPLTNEILMDVINLPGENHASILSMGDAAETAVFAAGNRLQLNNDRSEATASHSSGDGAWISQKCARTLGGTCSIRFEQNRTVFSLRCPATTYDVALGVPSNFRLPETTWGIAIDDSKIQRKMLQRFFSLAGIPKNQQLLLGQDPLEIRGFDQSVLNLVNDHPESYFLVIVDENLDITAAGHSAGHKEHTISGSLTIQKLRKELGPVLEERVLAVVRSANDSAPDIEVYNSRAHGFLHKAPIQKEKIMEVLAPLWVKRFPESVNFCIEETKESKEEEQESRVAAAKTELDTTPDDYVSAAFDVMETLEVIDALCMEDEAFLTMRWSLIWKKLQALKRELQTLEQSEVVEEALVEIAKLDGPKIPNDFLSQWATLRALIIRVV